MTTDNHRASPGNDILDRATAALQSVPIPPEPAAVLESTLAAVTARSRIVQSSTTRRRIVMRILGYSSLATAAAVLIGTGIVFLGTSRPTAAAEFKTAMENAAKARNMVVLLTTKLSPDGPQMKMQQTVQNEFVRTDFLNPGNIPKFPAAKELPYFASLIMNWKEEVTLHLDHADKITYFEKRAAEAQEPGYPDLVAGFRQLKNAEGITKAGSEQIGSIDANVYTLKTAECLGFKGPVDVKVWIDPKTERPVKVLIESNLVTNAEGKAVPGESAKVTLLFEDFRFDVKLKDDTFSMAVPKGYKAMTKEPAPAVEFISHTVNLEQAMENAAAAKTMKFDVMVPNLDANQKITFQPTRMYFTESAVRTEMLNPGGKQNPDIKAVPVLTAIVFDLKAKRAIAIDYRDKTYRPQRIGFQEMLRLSSQQFVDEFRDMKANAREAVAEPDEKLNGSVMKVFKIKAKKLFGAPATEPIRVWIDPKTNRPVKFATVRPESRAAYSAENLVFDAELDEELFNLTPKGFTESK